MICASYDLQQFYSRLCCRVVAVYHRHGPFMARVCWVRFVLLVVTSNAAGVDLFRSNLTVAIIF